MDQKMRSALRSLAAAAALTLSLLTACKHEGPRPRNVLLVTFDTTRWDHVGFGAGTPGTTPMLEAMAKRGTVFETALTAQPLTLPSHTTIMTGKYPTHHGVRNNGTYIVGEENLTLAERLSATGFSTHAVVSAFVLDSQFGLDQGFASYDDDLSGGPKQKMFMFKETPAAVTTARAASWLRDGWDHSQPFFLWVHYFDPHADYEPPPEFAARFPRDPYTGEIAYADQELGRLFKELEALGQLDDTLIVFTSDHGDGLGEHGEKTHGIFIYESTTRVPLLMAGPGVPKGARVPEVVRTADITPTILDLLGLPEDTSLDGRSLRPMWSGQADARTAYIETVMTRQNFGWSELRALRADRFKVIRAPDAERYDLKTDPGERRNLVAQPDGDAPQLSALSADLETIAQGDPLEAAAQDPDDLDPETVRKLQALGYVWAEPGAAGEDLPDPKDRLPYWIRFQEAQNLIRAKDYAAAAAAIEDLLKEDPDNQLARSSLATALSQMGKKEEALAILMGMVALGQHREAPYLGAARILTELKRVGEAQSLIQQVLDFQPKNPEGYTAMGDLLLDQERFDEAEPWFRKALDLDPHSSLAVSGLGNCLNRAGRIKEAEAVLAEGHRRDQGSHAITYNLAVVKEKLGDRPGALELYKQAIQLEPDHSMSWNNMGSLMEKDGQRDKAMALILKAHELDPENLEATYNLGALYLTSGDAARAVPLLEAAVRSPLSPPLAPQLLVRAYKETGALDKARGILVQIARQRPPVWLEVARLELDAGREEAAAAALAAGLAADGDRFRAAAQKDPRLAPLLP